MTPSTPSNGITRLAFFYDGSFFVRVSNYYKHYHDRKCYLSFSGLQEFVRQFIAKEDGIPSSRCQTVQSHFFRGRFSLQAAKSANALESDRYFDQLLMYAGNVSHYYPMNESVSPPQEKGIDVWMALEAYDLALRNAYDVLVLFVSDQDFMPLVRKVHGRGIRTLVISVDIRYTDNNGMDRSLATSQQLIHEASHLVWLSREIDKPASANDPNISSLFAVPTKAAYVKPALGVPRNP